jgi:SAM-dependent methyltransferase
MRGFDKNIRKLSQEFFEAELRDYGDVIPPSGQDASTLLELLHGAIPSNDDFHCLDIGCGLGYAARAVKRLSPGAKVFGVDISKAVIERARESAPSNAVSYEVADELSLPYESETFDLAVCRYSIHHYPDVVAHLREVRRVLRPGGAYLVIDPMPHPGKYDAWVNHLFVTVERSTSGHVKFYTASEYESFAKAGGFTIGKIEPFDFRLELDTRGGLYAVIRDMPADFQRLVAFQTQGNRFSIVMQAAGIYCYKAGS